MMTRFVEKAFLSTPPNAEPQAAPMETVETVFVEEPAAMEAVEAVDGDEPAPVEADEEQVAVLEGAEGAQEAAPVGQTRKRLIPVAKIEGIGAVYAQKLLEIGVKTTEELLEQGKTRKGREELVKKTGISSALVLRWVNMADLMRVHGIGEEYSELLEKAGVDTVKELRNRNSKNLTEAMIHANEKHKLVRRVPHYSEVEAWVKEAKELAPLVSYD
jgi:predicted flap endonuclease-1-like 5' DNA nuclease